MTKTKTTQTSSKSVGRPKKKYRTKKVLFNGVIVEVDKNSYNKAKAPTHKGNTVKAPVVEFEPDPPTEPQDEISKHRFPPPKWGRVFRQKWARFIDSVVDRKNFKEAHLELLEVLCDQYVIVDALNKFIAKNGMTYKVTQAIGETTKSYPEVAQRDKALASIQQYSRHLDLFPKKDTSGKGHSKKDESEWG